MVEISKAEGQNNDGDRIVITFVSVDILDAATSTTAFSVICGEPQHDPQHSQSAGPDSALLP